MNKGDSKSLPERYFSAQSVLLEDNSYEIMDEGGEEYAFVNPNFDYKELRSNLVVRWELRPGSTLYFVWNTSSMFYERSNNYSVSKSYGDLFGVKSNNVFMIKFNYWFSL
ncbi:DUF5916 domain-containing protein [uncultured Sunxiuqinia sp.]|uniref:DUF5916 domain-containing protein n=1 Tax=uncultured Sunxiuqinia sp. TaxID=1573825 RepID=UPI002AA658F3|nr:DUF5916 domain-containing protein [uncultured Sunxiuqinia sp.]